MAETSNTPRRSFLKAGVGTMAAMAAAAGVLEPLRHLERGVSVAEFLQQHYKRLTPEMLAAILRRLETEVARQYGAEVQIQDYRPLDGVEFGYALSLSRCNGSRRCVSACVKENNQSRDPQIQWIRVLEMEKSKGIDFESANPYYNPETVPDPDHFYLPVACQQ